MGGFAINGRFLTQNETGVQRYAREITRALDKILFEAGASARILTPAAPREGLGLKAMTVDVVRPFQGHLWEQLRLPLAEDGLILNLCNTASVLGRRNILCIHDASVFTAPESYSLAFRAFYKGLQPLISRSALAVATVSKDAASRIARHLGIKVGAITVLPNGHEHALRWNPAASRREKVVGRPYILMIGSVAKHKNIARIIGLANALDDLGLDIKVAGGSASIFTDSYQAAAPNLAFLGRVSDDDLAFLLQDAMCLAFPSISEGFGIPALEALTWGCPVVASDTTSLPEVCGNAALFADPHDDRQWLAHFSSLHASRDLREDLRGKGYEQAKRFSWSTSAQGYHELALSNARSPGRQ